MAKNIENFSKRSRKKGTVLVLTLTDYQKRSIKHSILSLVTEDEYMVTRALWEVLFNNQ